MQPNETTIDYSAVEQALAHNEANARMRIMTGQGLRALAVAAAIVAVVLAAAYAWQIAKKPKIETVEKIVEVPVETPAPILPTVPEQTGGKVVRSYVIFETVDADTVSPGLSVHVGHDYASSKQETYDNAYCYVARRDGGAQTRIDLSTKLPSGRPVPVPFSNGRALNLTASDMSELRALCPYL